MTKEESAEILRRGREKRQAQLLRRRTRIESMSFTDIRRLLDENDILREFIKDNVDLSKFTRVQLVKLNLDR